MATFAVGKVSSYGECARCGVARTILHVSRPSFGPSGMKISTEVVELCACPGDHGRVRPEAFDSGPNPSGNPPGKQA